MTFDLSFYGAEAQYSTCGPAHVLTDGLLLWPILSGHQKVTTKEQQTTKVWRDGHRVFPAIADEVDGNDRMPTIGSLHAHIEDYGFTATVATEDE